MSLLLAMSFVDRDESQSTFSVGSWERDESRSTIYDRTQKLILLSLYQ